MFVKIAALAALTVSASAWCNGRDSGCTNMREADGDCDRHNHCARGLKCGKDNCFRGRGTRFDNTDDCCYNPRKSRVAAHRRRMHYAHLARLRRIAAAKKAAAIAAAKKAAAAHKRRMAILAHRRRMAHLRRVAAHRRRMHLAHLRRVAAAKKAAALRRAARREAARLALIRRRKLRQQRLHAQKKNDNTGRCYYGRNAYGGCQIGGKRSGNGGGHKRIPKAPKCSKYGRDKKMYRCGAKVKCCGGHELMWSTKHHAQCLPKSWYKKGSGYTTCATKDLKVTNENQCAAMCKAKNHCCNDPKVGSNQMVSCAQACMMRISGVSKQECVNKVNQFASKRGQGGCRLTFGKKSFSLCQRCRDLTAKCPHGVQNKYPGLDGCNARVI